MYPWYCTVRHLSQHVVGPACSPGMWSSRYRSPSDLRPRSVGLPGYLLPQRLLDKDVFSRLSLGHLFAQVPHSLGGRLLGCHFYCDLFDFLMVPASARVLSRFRLVPRL